MQLSPSLSVYFAQWTSTFSILERISGLFLTFLFGLQLIGFYLASYFYSFYTFYFYYYFYSVNSWSLSKFLFGITIFFLFLFFFHLFNGLRFLTFDTLYGVRSEEELNLVGYKKTSFLILFFTASCVFFISCLIFCY